GRLSIPLGAKIRAPLREPAMIRIGEQLLDVVVQRAFVVDQPLGFGAGLFEKSSVRSQARELELGQARLAGAEQLAFASDLEVLLRKLEPVRRVDERLEPLLRVVGQLLLRARDQQAIRLFGATSDPAPQLVEL